MKTLAWFGLGMLLLVGACNDDPSPPVDASGTGDGGAKSDGASNEGGAKDAPVASKQHQVVLFVWDGLRPDSISPGTTPNLAQLRDSGVNFTDNHSTYPTFTMMNGASLATGHFPEGTGF